MQVPSLVGGGGVGIGFPGGGGVGIGFPGSPFSMMRSGRGGTGGPVGGFSPRAQESASVPSEYVAYSFVNSPNIVVLPPSLTLLASRDLQQKLQRPSCNAPPDWRYLCSYCRIL